MTIPSRWWLVVQAVVTIVLLAMLMRTLDLVALRPAAQFMAIAISEVDDKND